MSNKVHYSRKLKSLRVRISKISRIIWWPSSRSTEIMILIPTKCPSNLLRRTTINSFWRAATVSNQRPKRKLKLKCPCLYRCSTPTIWARPRVKGRLSRQDMARTGLTCFHQDKALLSPWWTIIRFRSIWTKWEVLEVWTPINHHARYLEFHRFRWTTKDHPMSRLITNSSNTAVIPRVSSNSSLLMQTQDLVALTWFLIKIHSTIKTWVTINIQMAANTMISNNLLIN